MNSIKDLHERKKYIAEEGAFLQKKYQELLYQVRVADEKNDRARVEELKAEGNVVMKMAKEKMDEIQRIDSEISGIQDKFKNESAKYTKSRNYCFAASLICFFMPNFWLGVVWLAIFLILAYNFNSKASDQRAYAAGYTEGEWDETKKEISREIKRENEQRERLAKSIADQLKK